MAEVARAETPAEGLPVVPIENQVVEALVERGWTLAVAESLTAGAVARRLCLCPGTEDRILGGVVAYSTTAKREVLAVAAEGVVTAAAATQMAIGVRGLFRSDVGVGVTGVAGPEEQDGEPVGTVFVGWSMRGCEGGARLACAGTPEQIRQQVEEKAMELVLAALRGDRAGRDQRGDGNASVR
jgi:nicotinamide-nucleotide amidase